MKILKVGICGWGNVATGMFNAIESNNKFIKQSGVNIAISCIGARRDNPKCNPGNVPVFRDIFEIPDQDIDVVIELIGGVEVARELILKSIRAGKHVITANKAVIFNHGDEIFAGICTDFYIGDGIEDALYSDTLTLKNAHQLTEQNHWKRLQEYGRWSSQETKFATRRIPIQDIWIERKSNEQEILEKLGQKNEDYPVDDDLKNNSNQNNNLKINDFLIFTPRDSKISLDDAMKLWINSGINYLKTSNDYHFAIIDGNPPPQVNVESELWRIPIKIRYNILKWFSILLKWQVCHQKQEL